MCRTSCARRSQTSRDMSRRCFRLGLKILSGCAGFLRSCTAIRCGYRESSRTFSRSRFSRSPRRSKALRGRRFAQPRLCSRSWKISALPPMLNRFGFRFPLLETRASAKSSSSPIDLWPNKPWPTYSRTRSSIQQRAPRLGSKSPPRGRSSESPLPIRAPALPRSTFRVSSSGSTASTRRAREPKAALD